MICLDFYGCSEVVERRQGPRSRAGGNGGINPFVIIIVVVFGVFLSFSK